MLTAGRGAMVDRRLQPPECPHAIDAVIVAAVPDARRYHLRWGEADDERQD
jgi:hypothetical protein